MIVAVDTDLVSGNKRRRDEKGCSGWERGREELRDENTQEAIP